jgi:pyruvate kinase
VPRLEGEGLVWKAKRMSRRAKIVATLGPASSSPERLAELVAAGIDVARLNMSHGTHAGHLAAYQCVRAASDAAGHSVGVLIDLQGPKIRLGTFAAGPVRLLAGQEFTITTREVPGDQHEAGTTYAGLADDVRPGDRVLVDDGRVVLEVLAAAGGQVRTRVIVGGVVSDHKGLNLPGVKVSVPALTTKDQADLRWALRLRADMIALSFVQGPEDAVPARRIMDEAGVRLPLIAKIEKPQAIEALPEVIEAFDGIMVARGDLGVELPLEQVPMAQKRIVEQTRAQAKPVIVATQMLESMISAPRPTRAEASDVANAVLDGADALMLSGETSVGKYPIVTVKTMAKIIEAVEAESVSAPPLTHTPRTMGGVLSFAARDIGERIGAKALVAFTYSGDTVRRLARLHTTLPVLAFTPREAVRNQLSLTWGVRTFVTPPVDTTDAMVEQVDLAMLEIPGYEPGDVVVIVAGAPPNTSGSTNLIRVHRLGHAD